MEKERLESLKIDIQSRFENEELVFGEGKTNGIMLIGEAPGKNEILQKKRLLERLART